MTRSANLLRVLLDAGALPAPRIAQALECAEDELAALAIGEPAMSPETQLRLAALVIAEVPALARQGHSLKGQAEASISFHGRRSTSSERPGWRKDRK